MNPSHGWQALCRIDTPLGPLTMLATARGLAAALFDAQAHHPGVLDAPVQPGHPHLRQAADEFDAYFTQGRRHFEVPLDPQGTGDMGGSCASCHGNPPTGKGVNALSEKPIPALAPAFNPASFTDRSKVDGWFKNNCKDVLNRECTMAEKADVLSWLLTLKP